MAGPSMAPDARVYLVGAPWRSTLFTDRYVRDGLRLYYGDMEMRGFKNEEAFLDANLQIRDEDTVYYYRDSGGSP